MTRTQAKRLTPGAQVFDTETQERYDVEEQTFNAVFLKCADKQPLLKAHDKMETFVTDVREW